MAKVTKREPLRYDSFVEHPRYGRYPHVTGLDPDPADPGVFLHWNATDPAELEKRLDRLLGWHLTFPDKRCHRISGTAVAANPSKQQPATVQVTHYYDVERRCCDCRRDFIFFALEQKHWYETLRFPLDADAIRCPDCRRKNQSLARLRAAYERLLQVTARTDEETARLIDVLLTLVENAVFGPRQTEHVRALLKVLPAARRLEFAGRLSQLERDARGRPPA